jgi:hypothetical protein
MGFEKDQYIHRCDGDGFWKMFEKAIAGFFQTSNFSSRVTSIRQEGKEPKSNEWNPSDSQWGVTKRAAIGNACYRTKQGR